MCRYSPAELITVPATWWRPSCSKAGARPSTVHSPLVGRHRPERSRTRVVFPAFSRPTQAMAAPWGTCRFSRRRAPRPPSYSFVKS